MSLKFCNQWKLKTNASVTEILSVGLSLLNNGPAGSRPIIAFSFPPLTFLAVKPAVCAPKLCPTSTLNCEIKQRLHVIFIYHLVVWWKPIFDEIVYKVGDDDRYSWDSISGLRVVCSLRSFAPVYNNLASFFFDYQLIFHLKLI